MPSKIEYELTKLRGEVSESQELYTDTIAALKDKITTLETKVTSLDAELESNKQKTDVALRKASKAIADESGALKKSGVEYLKATTNLGIFIKDNIGRTNGRIGVNGYGMLTDEVHELTTAVGVTLDGVLLKDSEVTTDVINEKTSTAGVTLDGVLLKDSEVTTDVINEKTGAAGVTLDGVQLKDSNVDTAGLKSCTISGVISGTPTEGTMGLSSHKLYVYLNGTWERITSAIPE